MKFSADESHENVQRHRRVWQRDFHHVEMSDDRCLSNQDELADRIRQLHVNSIFLVADHQAYEHSGAREWLAPVLAPYQVSTFSDFEPNPKLEHVLAGLRKFRASAADIVIAVGGGTAIDIAKLLVGFSDEAQDPLCFIEQRSTFSQPGVPLIAIPTSSGTGSEATQFAVVYKNGEKHSIDHPKLLAAYCVLNSDLTLNLPSRITAQTGLDAFCQAIESLWSVYSNEMSTRYASEAVRLVLEFLPQAVHSPNRTAREAMSRAAHLAGRAIHQTRTTAPHAISYALTNDYGIPHGHAVSLTLGAVLVHNAKVETHDSNDPRGPEHVRQTIHHILELLNCNTPEQANGKIQQFIQSLGCETNLGRLGIQGDTALNAIASKVNVERLRNNPRQLTQAQIIHILQELV